MTSTSTSASTSTLKEESTNNVESPVAKLAASKWLLPEDTRHKLQDIVNQLEEKTTNSKFLKFADGEEKF